jgi:hypothetical protein
MEIKLKTLPTDANLSTGSRQPQILPPGMTAAKFENCPVPSEAPPNPGGTAWRPLRLTKPNCNTVKTSFLRSFKLKYFPKTVCANLQDLMHKLGEPVFAYFAWNVETFKRFMVSKPDDTPQDTAAVANQKQTFNDSSQFTRAFFKRPIFIAGLHKEIMKRTYANFQAMYEAPLDFKVI